MDEFEMSARYISLHRQLLLGETMTLPEIEEHSTLEHWLNKRCGIEPAQVTRTIPTVVAPSNEIPTTRKWKFVGGQWVAVEQPDSQAIVNKSLSQMVTRDGAAYSLRVPRH